MIPYEDLCAALEAYQARTGGAPRPGREAGAPAAMMPPPMAMPREPPPLDLGDPPTAEVSLPGDPLPSISSSMSGDDEDGTQVGPMQPVYEDRSNELDIGDVLADEESK